MPVPELATLERRRAEEAARAGRAREPVTGAGHLPDGLGALAGEAARALEAGHAGRPRDPFAGMSAAHLVALQRAAGNRAVAASLQRARPNQLDGTADEGSTASAGDTEEIPEVGERAAVDPVPTAAANAEQVESSPEPEAQGQTLVAGAHASHHTTPSVQRASAAAAHQAPTRTADRNDYGDLLDGFRELAIAAVDEGGRGLDTVRFGRDLSSAHHAFLEHIRKVLILAQEHSPDSKRTAIAEWPPLAAKLQAALDHAKQLGFPDKTLAGLTYTVSLVGEKYVHAPHHGPAHTENTDDYFDLMNDVQRLIKVVQEGVEDRREQQAVPLNIEETNAKQRAELGDIHFGEHLTPQHRKLLENLRTALILARTEGLGFARSAFTLWQSIQGDLRHVFQRAPAFVGGDVSAIQQHLNRIGQQLIHGGVYAEEHTKALKDTDLQAPDLAFQLDRLKEAAEEFKEAKELADKALELTGEGAINLALGSKELGAAIVELAQSPKEIRELLEKFNKKGVFGKTVTVGDMADKILAARNAVVRVSCESVKRYAEKKAERALEQAVVERWKKIAEGMEHKLKFLDRVEKVGTVITVVVSVVKIVDALWHHKWDEAVEEAITKGAEVTAGAIGGAAGSVAVAGIVFMVAVEAEALHDFAEMLRYCEKANVREAALSFIYECTWAAKIEAKDLVADAKLLDDPSNAGERELIEKNLASYAPYWLRHVEALSNQLRDTRASQLGGQPELRDALGSDALRILQDPGTWAGSWQSMAEQIRVVFAGANAMAKYVVNRYPRSDKTEQKTDEGEKKEGGGGD